MKRIVQKIIEGLKSFLLRMADYEAERLISLYAPFSKVKSKKEGEILKLEQVKLKKSVLTTKRRR